MKTTQYIVKTNYRSSGGNLLSHRCSGAFVNEIKRSAFLVIILSVIIVLATGCSTTGIGYNARLIDLVPTTQRDANSKDDSWYQPVRSPAFSDLFGS
jgi:hypothetical protein